MTIYISRASILTLIVCLNFTLWTWPDVVATQVGPKIATRLENDVGSCPPLTLDMLGNNAEASTDGIIAAILSACVRVIQFHILCETPGLMKGTISSVSFLAEYRCIGITCQNVNSGDFETHIDQFQIRCNYNDGNFSFIFPNVSVATGSTISRISLLILQHLLDTTVLNVLIQVLQTVFLELLMLLLTVMVCITINHV